ncbi:MAG TPA: hypothetical protein VFL80_09750, partial [Thermoanaerobaculia bacterium]|nr:hypothetical protein [Thermoanaerobaculia bacterium]
MTFKERPNLRADLDAGEASAGGAGARSTAPAASDAGSSHLQLTAWEVAGVVTAVLLFIVLRFPL